MKAWNIYPVERDFDWGKMKVIELGERGRGRTFTIIPFHAHDCGYFDIAETRSGKPKIVCGNDEPIWLAVVSGAGVYTRNTYGTVYVPESQKDRVLVIARGHGAFGLAGRIGDWNEFLVAVKTGTWLKVRPAGGARKKPRYWLYFDTDKVYRIGTEELDAFCEATGVECPEAESLVDLVSFSTDLASNLEKLKAWRTESD